MLDMNNLSGIFGFMQPRRCSSPTDTPTPNWGFLLMQLVVVCDLLSNAIIVAFGATPPRRHLALSGGEQNSTVALIRRSRRLQ